MKDRQTGEGRQDQWTDQGDRSYEGNGGSERTMTRSSQTGTETTQQGSSSGNWSGYVVPYRYYGPGYRGVGYYSILYQGAGNEPIGSADWDEAGQGRSFQGGTGTSQGSSGFAGRGPKGYQRSDDRILEEVSDRLMADDRIDASQIEVQVKDCEVTLTGTVPDRWAKRLAEDVAEQVMGVRDVMNQIRVAGQSSQGQYGQSGQGGQYGQGQTGQTGKSTQTGQGSSQSSTSSRAGSSSESDPQQQQGDANGRRQKAGSTR